MLPGASSLARMPSERGEVTVSIPILINSFKNSKSSFNDICQEEALGQHTLESGDFLQSEFLNIKRQYTLSNKTSSPQHATAPPSS